MTKEEKKLQKHLVEEMMKVSETNPDVMFYLESLMEYCLKIEKELDKYKIITDKIKEYIIEVSYETMNNGRVFYNGTPAKSILELLEEIDEK